MARTFFSNDVRSQNNQNHFDPTIRPFAKPRSSTRTCRQFDGIEQSSGLQLNEPDNDLHEDTPNIGDRRCMRSTNVNLHPIEMHINETNNEVHEDIDVNVREKRKVEDLHTYQVYGR